MVWLWSGEKVGGLVLDGYGGLGRLAGHLWEPSDLQKRKMVDNEVLKCLQRNDVGSG